MTFSNALGSERFVVAGAIDPDSYNNADPASGWIDMSLYHRIMAVFMAGDMNGSGTVAVKLQKSLASNGSNPVDIAGKAITTFSGNASDDDQAIINLRADEIAPNDGYRYVALVTDGSAHANLYGALILGTPKYGGASFGNALMSEQIAVGGVIDPDAYASSASAVVSDAVDMSKFGRAMAVVVAGDLSSGATIAAKLEQGDNSSPQDWKDVSGKTVTVSVSNTRGVIDVRADELDIEGGYQHVRLSQVMEDATSPAGASDAAGVIFGVDPRYAPASDHDLASVVQIVA